MKLFISSDHGGFELKAKIISFLKTYNSNLEVEDLGPVSLNPDDNYPYYALKLAKEVTKTKDSMGILICRSGIGVCIAANKVKRIKAALCFTPEHAVKAREHNNANVLCLDSDYGDEQTHFEIVKKFLETQFAGWDTRHGERVKMIDEFEDSKDEYSVC